MLVSHRRRFIYLKTTKTAGTSVEVLFERECLPEGAYQGPAHDSIESETEAGIVGARMDGVKQSKKQWLPHISAVTLRDKIGAAVWDDYLKFCVIRNPFDRTVSLWWWLAGKAQREALATRDFAQTRRAFNDWVMSGVDLWSDRDKYMIEGQVCMDRFLRYEHLWKDITGLCTELGITRNPAELQSYKSDIRKKGEPFQDYYEPAAATRVARFFDWEIERFGYSLG